jgi:hypothetical protein
MTRRLLKNQSIVLFLAFLIYEAGVNVINLREQKHA